MNQIRLKASLPNDYLISLSPTPPNGGVRMNVVPAGNLSIINLCYLTTLQYKNLITPSFPPDLDRTYLNQQLTEDYNC